MTRRRTRIRNWILLGLSLGLAGLVLVVVCDLHGVFDYHTSDQELIDNFRTHRHDFEILAAMAIEDDDVIDIYGSSVLLKDYEMWPGSNRFSWKRWDEYGALFKRLGTEHLLNKTSGVVQIPASLIATELDANLEYRVSAKGYAFSQTPLSSLDDSLDEMGIDDLGTRYRRIDEHWYLYHDCGIGKPE